MRTDHNTRTDKLKQPAAFYSSIPVEYTFVFQVSSIQYIPSTDRMAKQFAGLPANTMFHFFYLTATKSRLGNDFTLSF